jgi:hypothetical protein
VSVYVEVGRVFLALEHLPPYFLKPCVIVNMHIQGHYFSENEKTLLNALLFCHVLFLNFVIVIKD